MKKTRYAVCIFLSLFFFAIINSTLGALLTETINHYHLVESQQGLPVSMLNIGCIAALISSLWIMGRVRKPHLVWIASTASVLLLVPMGLPPSFAVFTAMFLLMGLAVGYTDTLASSIIADLYNGKRAAVMMCMLHATFGMAGIVSPLAFQSMMQAGLSWNGVYTVLFFVGVAFLAYIVPVSVSQARSAPAQHASSQRLTLAEIGRFFKTRASVMLLCAIFFYGFFISAIAIWVDRYVRVGLGSAELGALSLSLFWLGLAASRLISPLLKVKPATLIYWSAFSTAALVAAGIATGSAPIMCAASGLGGLLSGSIIPMLIHIACQQYKSNTLMATTFLLLGLYVAQSICPPMMGVIASSAGLTAAMWVAPIAVTLCGFAAWMVEKAEK